MPRVNIFATVLVLSLLIFIAGCVEEKNNTEVSRADSPDGKYSAIVFVRDVGATTDFSTQVSIIRRGSVLRNSVGNIFTCDSDHGKATSLEDHSYWAKVSWLSPTDLVIQYDQKVRVFKKSDKYKSISIRFEPVDLTIMTAK